MLKKTLKYVLKIILVVVLFSIPTIIVFIYLLLDSKAPEGISLAFLYLAPIIIIVFMGWKTLVVWETSIYLFALSLGFLITMIPEPLTLYVKGGPLWNMYGGFFGKSGAIMLWCLFFSFPFAVLAFIPAIVARHWRKHPQID